MIEGKKEKEHSLAAACFGGDWTCGLRCLYMYRKKMQTEIIYVLMSFPMMTYSYKIPVCSPELLISESSTLQNAMP